MPVRENIVVTRVVSLVVSVVIGKNILINSFSAVLCCCKFTIVKKVSFFAHFN